MRSLRLGLRDINRQRSRYLLVGISTLLGVLAVVGVGISGTTAKDALIAQQEQLSGRATSLSVSIPVSELGLDEVQGIYRRLSDKIGASSVDAGVRITRGLRVQKDPVRAASEGMSLTWTLGDMNGLYRQPVVAGMARPHSEEPYPVAVTINQRAAEQLDVTVRDTLYFSSEQGERPVAFLVGAVISDGVDEARGYAPLSTAELFFRQALASETAEFRVRMDAHSESSGAALLSEVFAQAGFPLQDPPRRVDTVRSVAEQLDLLNGIFNICAVIILIVSALGIANVGMATVTERSRELTIRRALGARSTDIFGQMIFASLIIGIMVGFLAIIAAIVGVYVLVPLLLPTTTGLNTPVFPWAAALTGLGAALGTSLLGGALPAISATRIPIALALRA